VKRSPYKAPFLRPDRDILSKQALERAVGRFQAGPLLMTNGGWLVAEQGTVVMEQTGATSTVHHMEANHQVHWVYVSACQCIWTRRGVAADGVGFEIWSET